MNCRKEWSNIQSKMNKKLIMVLGPTASGKTDYSVSLAERLGSPVISCDSRQIFRELKIGTAPPSPEQLQRVKHYFIFSNSIHEHYTAGQYETDALNLLDELFKTHDTLVVTGGSGLYADALSKGLDDFPPSDMELRGHLMSRLANEGIETLREELRVLDAESYNQLDTANTQRVIRALEVTLQTGKKFSSYKNNTAKQRPFQIERRLMVKPREELYRRIDLRVDMMMEAGLLKEAESLFDFRHLTSLKTVGYRELFDYMEGKSTLPEAVELIKRNTRRYAKRQITWWRRYDDMIII
ncbi:MAG: tRNA (adenosine(37)-N6)-dimethylallyltransferase MiaA [Bacteroidetes bacterium HGW-Bacteroidetes-10]|nr:MAG: tRNA (adenosine(37)-N6)-dimethylallyltransferase MiaA [Bacteroidetes bacterium HGW-Bacteroidetes-10]